MNYAKRYANKHKDKKFVLEGIWFFSKDSTGKQMFSPSDFDNYAFYIKGTSELISYLRASKRDSQDADSPIEKTKSFAKLVTSPERHKWYKADEQQLNIFRKYFRNKL